MPGDTLDVTVTFPDPYLSNTDLSGKEATFKTTIHYIHGDSQVPELTEEFVQNYLSYYYGYSSVADMKAQMTAQLLAEQQYNYVLDWLYQNSTFQVPDQLVEDQISLLRIELENAANTYGVTPDELAAQYGVDSQDALLELYRPSLENMIKQHLMCQAVAEEAGITVDEQAVNDYFSNNGVADCSSYLESYGQGYVYQGVRTELVAQYLIDHVTESVS
jgi:trigger factor